MADAKKLMLFSSDKEALAYAEEVSAFLSLVIGMQHAWHLAQGSALVSCYLHDGCRSAAQRGWTVRDGNITFEQSEDPDAGKLPSLELIDNALTYAREIERIV